MEKLNIAKKVTGDKFYADEMNQMVEAINTLAGTATSQLLYFKAITKTSQLPTNPTSTDKATGYLYNGHIIVYVGNGGNMNNGTYQDCGAFKGDKGDTGSSGFSGAATDLEVIDNLTSEKSTAALSANQGVVIKKMLDNISTSADKCAADAKEAKDLTSMLKEDELDLSSQFTNGGFINSKNTVNYFGGYAYIQNYDISKYFMIIFEFGNVSSAVNVLTDADGKVLFASNCSIGYKLDLRKYPTAKYLSMSFHTGSKSIKVCYQASDTIQDTLLNYNPTAIDFAASLSKKLAIKPTFIKGSFFNSEVNLIAKADAMYTPNYEIVPSVATKAYYTGASFGAADGGIIWYNSKYEVIGVVSMGGNTTVQNKEVIIPTGAVYYKASSYYSPLNVTFDLPTNSLTQLDQVDVNKQNIADINSFVALTAENFEKYSNEVDYPTGVDTASAGSGASGIWGMLLTNGGTIKPTSVTFYSSSAKTSFVIAVGTAKTNGSYKINNSYTITANVVAGQNTIDISSYNIQIPPRSFVVCTGATNYQTKMATGASTMIIVGSFLAGASGKGSWFNNLSMKWFFSGIEEGLKIKVPENTFNAALKSNILYGKKYTAIGDSFTDNTNAYCNKIGERNQMRVLNQGSSGSVLGGYITGKRYNSIPTDVDYVTIWYGINDAGHGISIGTVDDEVETWNSEKDGSTCAAFNWIFRWLLTNRPLAHVGVIITDFCAQDRREAIMACCEKWGIAYLDLYDPTVPTIRTRGNTKYTHSTTIAPNGYVQLCDEAKTLRSQVFSMDETTHANMHPNATCHNWQSNIIEQFMRGL